MNLQKTSLALILAHYTLKQNLKIDYSVKYQDESYDFILSRNMIIRPPLHFFFLYTFFLSIPKVTILLRKYCDRTEIANT